MGSLPHSWTDQVDARRGGRCDRWLQAKASGARRIPRHAPHDGALQPRRHSLLLRAWPTPFTVCDYNFCSSLDRDDAQPASPLDRHGPQRANAQGVAERAPTPTSSTIARRAGRPTPSASKSRESHGRSTRTRFSLTTGLHAAKPRRGWRTLPTTRLNGSRSTACATRPPIRRFSSNIAEHAARRGQVAAEETEEYEPLRGGTAEARRRQETATSRSKLIARNGDAEKVKKLASKHRRSTQKAFTT